MVGDIDERRSTSGVLVFLGSAALSWLSLKQKVVALSKRRMPKFFSAESRENSH